MKMPKKQMNGKINVLNKLKNRYFRRRLCFIVIFVIILILVIDSSIKFANKMKIENQRREYESKIFGELQEKTAQVTEFYTYGTHFQISGTVDSIEKDNFENAKLVLVSDSSEQEFSISGNIEDNKLVFSSVGNINSGIGLDDLSTGNYYLKLRVKANNSTSAKYYTFSNNSTYPNIEYYTATRNGKNNKVNINFSEYETIDNKKVSCLNFKIEESSLPDDVYDIVIDAGKGGKDVGAKAGGYEEKNINLDCSKLLKTELEQRGYKVKLTRDDENTASFTATNMYDKNGRIDIACSSKAKLMISLHMNDGSSKLSGLEIYAPCKSDLTLARKMANTIIDQTFMEYSNNTSFKETDGVYVKNYTKSMIKDLEETAKKKKFDMYNVTEDTPYLYTIREVGGIATGAYVDGRNTAYGKNEYYNSNQGIECYQIEMGYMNSDLQKVIEEEEDIAYAISEAIAEVWR